jgi:hypothetical protein
VTDTPTPVYLSLAEAVKAVEVSRTTMQRRLAAGEIDGAHRTESGGWAIPYSGLVAAGLTPRVTGPDTGTTGTTGATGTTEAAGNADELERLRTQLAALHQEVTVLRGQAEERAATIATLTMVIERVTAYQLMRAPVEPTATPEPSATPVAPVEPVSARWWRRRR